MKDKVYKSNDRELYREPLGPGEPDSMSYYKNSIFLTEEGSIGIAVDGSVYVKPLVEWHELAGGAIKLKEQK